jgi:hypothetical protein
LEIQIKSGRERFRFFFEAPGQRQDFLLARMGTIMIAEMMPPMTTIWSVDPITDRSSA